MRRTIMITSAILLALIIFFTTITIHPYTEHRAPQTLNNNVHVTASYILTVKHGDQTKTITKQNDPITKWWIYAVIDNLLLQGTNLMIPWYDTSGTSHTTAITEISSLSGSYDGYYLHISYTKSLPTMYIAFGDGNGTASYNDYSLFNLLFQYPINTTSVTLNITSGYYNVTLYFSTVSNNNFNITELGLILHLKTINSGTVSDTQLLVCHDNVPLTTINVNDTISIRYIITIRFNPNGGLTENFFNALIDYFLGAKATGVSLPIRSRNGASVILNTGYNELYFYTTSTGTTITPKIVNQIYSAIGNATSNTWTTVVTEPTQILTLTAPFIANNLTGESILQPQYVYVNPNVVNMTIKTSFIFTYTYTAKELGLYLYTGIAYPPLTISYPRSKTYTWTGYILMVYYYFPNGVTISPTQSGVVTININFPLT